MSFRIEAFQNRYLSPATTRVDAILQVTAGADVAPASGRGGAPGTTGGSLVVGFIIDKSGSMGGERMDNVKRAVHQAIEMLDPNTWFFIVAFDATAQVVIRESQANDANKQLARKALGQLAAGGGTAMSTGLEAARKIFMRAPDAIHEAIFLTDGKNEGEAPEKVSDALRACEGKFECDCWGVGTDWQVGEVQDIAEGLLGKASLIPDPSGIAEAFQAAIGKASSKALKDVRLRLWTPQGASVAYVKQVNPTIDDLTNKPKIISPQVREYFTGAWAANEARDFHVGIDVRAGSAGEEMLACRPSVAYMQHAQNGWAEQEVKAPEARIFATWTGDDTLSSRIDNHVAHYTGQGELAKAIQEGLEMRSRGNDGAATQLLGKAVKIAHASGNSEMTHRLAKVVDVVDAAQGTVRLKKDVQKAATMDLQLESRTTKRVQKK